MNPFLVFFILIIHSAYISLIDTALCDKNGVNHPGNTSELKDLQSFTLKGKILSSNGDVLKMAHVRSVIADDWNYTEVLTKAKKDGSFEIALSKDRNVYHIFFTGVHHKHRHITIFSELGDCELEVRLEPISIDIHCKINGVLNNVYGFYPLNKVESERSVNGKYFFDVDQLPKGTTHYQVTGDFNGDIMRISGPNGPYITTENINGSDGYASAIVAEDQYLIINLKKYKHRIGKGKVRFISDSGIYQQAAFEAFYRIDDFINSMMTELMTEKDKSEFKGIIIQPEFDRIERLLTENDDNLLRQILLVEYLGFDAVRSIVRSKDPERQGNIFDGNAKPDILESIIEYVPAHTSLWHIESRGLFWLVNELPLTDDNLTYFENIYMLHPEESFRAMILYALSHKYKKLENQDDFSDAFGQLVSKYPEHPYTFKAKKEFGLSSQLNEGHPVPEFKLHSLDDPNEILTPQKLLGRIYLIDFWATWCRGCILKMPSLRDVYNKYNKKGFEILSISLDNREELVNHFRQNRHSLPWFNSIETQGFKSDIVKQFEVSSIPKSILVGPDGNILALGDAEGLNIELELKNYYNSKN